MAYMQIKTTEHERRETYIFIYIVIYLSTLLNIKMLIRKWEGAAVGCFVKMLVS